jgi:hypothetical protein
MASICVTFMTYVCLLAVILSVVMSGIGYSYFNSSWIISNPRINTKILFGCGIGLTIGLFCAIWFFFAATKNACNWICTFPLYVMLFGLYLAFTVPSVVDSHLESWGENWQPSLTNIQDLQWENKCCGWKNASDRGLPLCPDNFQSGCADLARAYFEPRVADLLVAFISIFALLVGSVIILVTCTWCVEEEDDIAQCCAFLDVVF